MYFWGGVGGGGGGGRLCHSHIHLMFRHAHISPDCAVTKSLDNGLVGTGFTSQYRLQHRAGFKRPLGRCKATTRSSFSLTSNMVTTNY